MGKSIRSASPTRRPEPAVAPLKVTIGILCFNQVDLIGSVIESARQQTREADEILVVDDGSTDESRTVVQSYPGVRLVTHSENRGRGAARTTVLSAASGDVVVYLDGDTTADPALVENLLAEYEPDVGAVGAVVREVTIQTLYDRWRAKHATELRLTEPNRDASVLYGWGLSCRRQLALDLGGLRAGSEDIDLTMRIRKSGARLVLTPRARVYHLRTDSWRTLQDMVFRWGFGGYVACARNGDLRTFPHVKRMMRRTRNRLTQDVLRDFDLRLAGISLLLIPPEIFGVLQARRWMRTGRVDPARLRGL